MLRKLLQTFVWILLPVISFFLGLSLRPDHNPVSETDNAKSQAQGQTSRGLFNRQSIKSKSSGDNNNSAENAYWMIIDVL